MNNAFRDKSKDHKSTHYWFRYLLGQGLNNHNLISLSPYPREISQATMMAGSTRWQSAVIGGNGAWRARMRTMNPKSNRTCLYRRSDRGPVLRQWRLAGAHAHNEPQNPTVPVCIVDQTGVQCYLYIGAAPHRGQPQKLRQSRSKQDATLASSGVKIPVNVKMSASMGSSIIQSRSWHEYSGSNEPEQLPRGMSPGHCWISWHMPCVVLPRLCNPFEDRTYVDFINVRNLLMSHGLLT